MADWEVLTARAGIACHDLVGWMMWDRQAIAGYEALGVPDGMGWVVTWRLASLGDVTPAVAAAAAYSINRSVIAAVMNLYRDVTDTESILAVRDAAVEPGLADIAPGLGDQLADLAEPLWRGVDSVHFGARPMLAAHRAQPRPANPDSGLSAWLAANCLRELRGDNHWALCASEDLDDVEVGLLHSVMIDLEEYGSEEWIARSRGNDDDAVLAGWARLEAKGLATGGAINDEGHRFRLDLEARTDALTAPAWQAVGEQTTTTFCELVESHHDAFVARIDETAGPRWMPAVRVKTPYRPLEVRR
ncbi:MAG: hypothetical protein GY724_11465 [Actinomycetia bacterium]|nr:hypothetical protein [Actinomycetes bacterium]